MPVILTTPFNTGDMGAGSYPQAKIVWFAMALEERRMEILVEWGDTVDGVWIKSGIKQETYHVIEDAYDALMAAHPSTYGAVKLDLYQYLVDQGILSGTIT